MVKYYLNKILVILKIQITDGIYLMPLYQKNLLYKSAGKQGRLSLCP